MPEQPAEPRERSEPSPASEVDSGAAEPAQRRLRLSQPEIAWPLAILVGFLGAALGLATGFPGFVAVPATIGFAPLYMKLVGEERLVLAALTASAWTLAVAAAVLGTALETSVERVQRLLPLAAAYGRGELGFLDGRAPGSDLVTLPRNLLVVAALVLCARPWRGVSALFLVGSVAATLSAGAAPLAAAGIEAGESPSVLFLRGWPPQLLVALIATVFLCTAVASPARLLPLSELAGVRRRLLFGGAGVAFAALLSQPLLAPLWRDSFVD